MSYVWGYLKGMVNSVLGYLGFYNKKTNIVFLGLDNAGKSSLLYVLNRKSYSNKANNTSTFRRIKNGKSRFKYI